MPKPVDQSPAMRPPALTAFLLLVFVAHSAVAAELISRGANGAPLPGFSSEPTISGDGRIIAFSSTAQPGAPGPSSKRQVYVVKRDPRGQGAVKISDPRGGDQPILAANGRFLVYRSLEDY